MTDRNDSKSDGRQPMSRERQRELVSWVFVAVITIYVLIDPLLGEWVPNSAVVGALGGIILALLLSDRMVL